MSDLQLFTVLHLMDCRVHFGFFRRVILGRLPWTYGLYASDGAWYRLFRILLPALGEPQKYSSHRERCDSYCFLFHPSSGTLSNMSSSILSFILLQDISSRSSDSWMSFWKIFISNVGLCNGLTSYDNALPSPFYESQYNLCKFCHEIWYYRHLTLNDLLIRNLYVYRCTGTRIIVIHNIT